MLPEFPRIPQLVDGMALSAETLNSYHRGLQFLLGRAREARIAHQTSHAGMTTTSTSDTVMRSGYAPTVGTTLRLKIGFRTLTGGTWWNGTIQVYTTAWQTVWSGFGNADTWTMTPETVSLSGVSGLEQGKICQWRILLRASGTAGEVGVKIWNWAIAATATGWTTPPTFTAGLSSAAQLNIIRTDLNALRAWDPGYSHLLSTPRTGTYVDADLWHTFTGMSLRWKTGQQNRFSVELGGYVADNADHTRQNWVQWGVNRSEEGGGQEALFEQTLWREDFGAGEYTRFTATPSETGTSGKYYQYNFWVRIHNETTPPPSYNTVKARMAQVQRILPPEPSASWPTLVDWVHGDTDVGPTNLNKLRTALLALYTGGVEDLMPEIPIEGGGELVGVHSRPWLVYKAPVGKSVMLYYGPDPVESYGLPECTKTNRWQSFYLNGLKKMTPGSRYTVEGVDYAVEADEGYA